DRRYRALCQTRAAGRLSGAEPERAAIRTGPGIPRPDHKARPRARARHAGRGGLGPGTLPGPPRSFFLPIQSRGGQHVAAVATARKLAILIWHLLTKNENYLWARPALHARKLRDLELKAGHRAARGRKGTAHAYNLQSHRDQERRWVEQAEAAYARFVAGWNAKGPKARTGAAKEERQ